MICTIRTASGKRNCYDMYNTYCVGKEELQENAKHASPGSADQQTGDEEPAGDHEAVRPAG